MFFFSFFFFFSFLCELEREGGGKGKETQGRERLRRREGKKKRDKCNPWNLVKNWDFLFFIIYFTLGLLGKFVFQIPINWGIFCGGQLKTKNYICLMGD